MSVGQSSLIEKNQEKIRFAVCMRASRVILGNPINWIVIKTLSVYSNSNSSCNSLPWSKTFSSKIEGPINHSSSGWKGFERNKMDIVRARELRNKLGKVYPFGGPERFSVPSDKTDWKTCWDEYNPPTFTIPAILKGDKPWADPEIGKEGFSPKWNEIDGKLNRKSWEGEYETDKKGYPLNPVGRTGLGGRGSLGKWGPNHAADAIVTRWKRNDAGEKELIDNKPVLQFVAISRQDTGELAIPGGMVDPGENPFDAAKREFLEEVFGIEEIDAAAQTLLERNLQEVFKCNAALYRGYVDDRRSTDNAWIETHAVNYHLDEKDNALTQLQFSAGSDAKTALWVDINETLNLYASHGDLIKKVVNLHSAYY